MMALPFKRAESDVTATYALYGKLRNRADFVRVNADHATALELDDLVQRSIESLACDDKWEVAYDAGAPVEFHYVSKDLRNIFLGILVPSCDQVGRRYPFVAGAILPCESVSGYSHVAPIAYEVFFDGLHEQASTAVENSVEALSCRQFLESQLKAKGTAASDLSLAKSVVDRFMQTASVECLNDLLITDGRATTLEQALLNLTFYRAFLRRFEHRWTNQVIQLPLPANKGEQTLVASAWLSILHTLWQGPDGNSRWHGTYLIVQRPAEAAQLAACFGNSQEKLVTIMLGGELDANARFDLCTEHEAWKNHRLYAEVSYALGRLLTERTVSLNSLCTFLRDVGRELEGAI